MICVTCRYCQDQKLPHLCITRGGALSRLGDHAVLTEDLAAFGTVIAVLSLHPARPCGDDMPVGTTDLPVLRADVHWTWCDCGCSDQPATPQRAVAA